MKKIGLFIISVFSLSTVYALQVGDVEVMGKVLVNEMHVSTVGKTASIWFIDGSSLTKGNQSSLAIGTGTSSNMSVISSGSITSINFSSTTFTTALTGGGTTFIALDADLLAVAKGGADGTVLVGGSPASWSSTPTLTSLVFALGGSDSSAQVQLGGANYGFYNLNQIIETVVAGTKVLRLSTNGFFMPIDKVFQLNSGGSFGWAATVAGADVSDVLLYRDAATVLALRNSTNAQTFRVYGTYTDASNYVRASLTSDGTSSITLAAETAGTGADNIDIALAPAGSGAILLNSGTGSILQKFRTSSAVAKGGIRWESNSGGSFPWFIGAFNLISTGDLEFTRNNGSNALLLSVESGASTQTVTLDNGTGNEVANTLSYTVNKLTSGNDTGLLISMTDTASPGTSKPLSIQTGASGTTEVLSVTNAGRLTSADYVIAASVWANQDNSALSLGSSQDIFLYRDAAATLAQRNSTTAQTFRVYGTYTDASNYVRGVVTSNGTSSVTLAAETAGTGADDIDVVLSPAGIGIVRLSNAITIGTNINTSSWTEIGLNESLASASVNASIRRYGSTHATLPYYFDIAQNQNAPLRLLTNATARLTISGAGLITSTVSLVHASDNEVARTINYTTNKAAGNDTGLLISMTDTASPGTSLPLDIQVGGNSILSMGNSTNSVAGQGLVLGPRTTDGVQLALSSGSLIVLRGDASTYAALEISTLTLRDGGNMLVGTTTGSKIGTATTQKLAFWNAAPIVQPSSTGETSGFTAGSGTAVNDDSTFTGNVGSTAYRISDIVKHLKNIGLIAQ